MKLFMSSPGFLILLLMLSAERSQAIRLLSKTSPSLHYQVNVSEKKRYNLFKEERGTHRYGLPYGHCPGRKSRQLMTTLDKGTSNKEQNPNKEKKNDLDREQKEIHQEILGVDYSPAQKKPPIHN